ERVVRAARRLADQLNGDWIAVHVETPREARLSPERREQLNRALHLAQELGAEVVMLHALSVATAVTEYAHSHNITKVIAGHALRPRWRDMLEGSVVERFMRTEQKLDVYIVAGEEEKEGEPGKAPAAPLAGAKAEHLEGPWKPWVQAIWLVSLATGVG